jgi:hypothetical protein
VHKDSTPRFFLRQIPINILCLFLDKSNGVGSGWLRFVVEETVKEA